MSNKRHVSGLVTASVGDEHKKFFPRLWSSAKSGRAKLSLMPMSERLTKINKAPGEAESKTSSETFFFPPSTHRHQHPLHNCKQIQTVRVEKEQLSRRAIWFVVADNANSRQVFTPFTGWSIQGKKTFFHSSSQQSKQAYPDDVIYFLIPHFSISEIPCMLSASSARLKRAYVPSASLIMQSYDWKSKSRTNREKFSFMSSLRKQLSRNGETFCLRMLSPHTARAEVGRIELD
jgi:hypothetical protein